MLSQTNVMIFRPFDSNSMKMKFNSALSSGVKFECKSRFEYKFRFKFEFKFEFSFQVKTQTT